MTSILSTARQHVGVTAGSFISGGVIGYYGADYLASKYGQKDSKIPTIVGVVVGAGIVYYSLNQENTPDSYVQLFEELPLVGGLSFAGGALGTVLVARYFDLSRELIPVMGIIGGVGISYMALNAWNGRLEEIAKIEKETGIIPATETTPADETIPLVDITPSQMSADEELDNIFPPVDETTPLVEITPSQMSADKELDNIFPPVEEPIPYTETMPSVEIVEEANEIPPLLITGKVEGNKILSGRDGGFLPQGQYLYSPTRKFFLIMQDDGNAVIYRTSPSQGIWATHTSGKGSKPYNLWMQGDGNLVIYGFGGQSTWSSETRGVGPFVLELKDDASMTITDGTGRVTWNNNIHTS